MIEKFRKLYANYVGKYKSGYDISSRENITIGRMRKLELQVCEIKFRKQSFGNFATYTRKLSESLSSSVGKPFRKALF